MHARTVVSDQRLRHERCSIAVSIGDVFHAVLVQLCPVGHIDQSVIANSNFRLTCSADFVVMFFNINTHVEHGLTHGRANVDK